MHPILKNCLAVLAGIAVGMFVNGGIISISGSIIPPPEGADLTTPEGLEAAMKMMTLKHFLLPFLAHALGTLVGAWITILIGVKKQRRNLTLIIGGLFLLGGIAAVFMIPGAPLWFIVLDLGVAYIPMALLGVRLAGKKS